MIPRKYFTLPDGARDHIQGAIDGPIALLEYGDYECPFCAEVQPVVDAVIERMGDSLCFGFRHFPMASAHPHAEHAAEAAEAAGAQGKFWEMHEVLFQNQHALADEYLAEYAAALGLDTQRFIDEVLSETYANRIREDFRSGVRGGVNGTPCFFINGQRYDGARALEPLLAVLTQDALAI
jgi:protein-disulfide isomerase